MTAEQGTTSRIHVLLGTREAPQLIRWSTWWGNPSNFDSYAIPSAGGTVVIDPDALTEDGERELFALLGGAPKHIILTNDNHERDAYALKERWGVEAVWAPAYGTVSRGGEMEGTPDRLYEDGDALPGGLRARKLSGGAFAGDTFLVWDAPVPPDSATVDSAGASKRTRVLFTGDTLNGAFNAENPIGPHPRRSEAGLYLGAGPPYLVRCDPDILKTSLRAFLEEDIALICGAHGDPWHQDPVSTLGRLLDTDWTPFLQEKRHPVVR